MLIYEKGENLLLLPAVPREWLEDGKNIRVNDVVTYFGRLSLNVISNASKGVIEFHLDPPINNPPKFISIRIKHPSESSIRRVQIDGKEWTDFENDLVNLGSIEKPVKVTAYY